MSDQPTRLEATEALAGLVRALVSSAAEDGPTDRGAYAENRWAALRFGREARLIHPDGSRLASVAELVDELAARLGNEVIDPVRGLDQAGEQLSHGRAEGMRALCEQLVALT
jgi:gamma-glutamyl:cysteine ligase YbdK (ATP-grasp superfamily)